MSEPQIYEGIVKKMKEEDYKTRNKKAIEYIEKHWKKNHYYEDIENCMTFCEYDKNDLLNILRGKE